MDLNINKFSWQQMTANSDGKTSATGSMGALCVTAGVLCFIGGVVFYIFQKDSQIMTQSLMLIGSGSAILAYRKSHDGPLAKTMNEVPEEPAPPVEAKVEDISEKKI